MKYEYKFILKIKVHNSQSECNTKNKGDLPYIKSADILVPVVIITTNTVFTSQERSNTIVCRSEAISPAKSGIIIHEKCLNRFSRNQIITFKYIAQLRA